MTFYKNQIDAPIHRAFRDYAIAISALSVLGCGVADVIKAAEDDGAACGKVNELVIDGMKSDEFNPICGSYSGQPVSGVDVCDSVNGLSFELSTPSSFSALGNGTFPLGSASPGLVLTTVKKDNFCAVDSGTLTISKLVTQDGKLSAAKLTWTGMCSDGSGHEVGTTSGCLNYEY